MVKVYEIVVICGDGL